MAKKIRENISSDIRKPTSFLTNKTPHNALSTSIRSIQHYCMYKHDMTPNVSSLYSRYSYESTRSSLGVQSTSLFENIYLLNSKYRYLNHTSCV